MKRQTIKLALILASSAVVGFVGMRFAFLKIVTPYETGNYREFLPPIADGVEVAVFGTSTCPACARARAFLSRSHVPFHDIDVTASLESHRQFAGLGGSTVPVIVVRNRKFIGFSEEALTSTLTDFGLDNSREGGLLEE